MRHLSPEDQLGDAATAHDPKPYPVPVAGGPGAIPAPGSVPAAEAKPPKWARGKPPTDGKEAAKWLRQIEEGQAVGVPFYHPGRGQNVVKAADGTLTPISPDVGDEEAWFAGGCIGCAPLLKDRPPEPKREERKAPKKGD